MTQSCTYARSPLLIAEAGPAEPLGSPRRWSARLGAAPTAAGAGACAPASRRAPPLSWLVVADLDRILHRAPDRSGPATHRQLTIFARRIATLGAIAVGLLLMGAIGLAL